MSPAPAPATRRMRVRPAPRPAFVAMHDLHEAPARRGDVNTPHATVRTHFGRLQDPLVEFIAHSEVLVGCVAWITNRQVLEALAQRRVALVVQKEDWWKKPDARGVALRSRYAALRGDIPTSALPAPLSRRRHLLSPISCLGYGATHQGRPGGATPPLMHHKFLVRCSAQTSPGGQTLLLPSAVWTGSFNFSGNADDSFENAVEIHDPGTAASFLSEFALVASLAESMDWRLGRPCGSGRTEPLAATTVPSARVETGSVRRATARGSAPVAAKPKPKTPKSGARRTSRTAPSAPKPARASGKAATTTARAPSKTSPSTTSSPRGAARPSRGRSTPSSRGTGPRASTPTTSKGR